MNFKDRIIRSKSVWSQFLPKQKLFDMKLTAGAAAGDVTVTGIKKGDELISVFDLTNLVDYTGEFSITNDDTINNAGGTTTAATILQVTYLQWKKR